MTDNFAGISHTIFEEPEYRDPVELLIAIYCITNSDMLGVCPFKRRIVAEKCRTSVRKLNNIVTYFESIGKLLVGGKGAGSGQLVWWKSKVNHSLYRGNCSRSQLEAVQKQLRKWHEAGIFGKNFAMAVVQHVETKYSFTIPFVLRKQGVTTEADTDTESESKTESEAEATQKQQQTRVDESRLRKINESIQFSEFSHALGKGCRGWIESMIRYFKPPEFLEDQIERGLESLFEHQREKGWHPYPKETIRPKIWKWIERQVDNKIPEYEPTPEHKAWLESDD